jgi:hypothetical protein
MSCNPPPSVGLGRSVLRAGSWILYLKTGQAALCVHLGGWTRAEYMNVSAARGGGGGRADGPLD